MKSHSSRSKRGFTLVELLVVIAIIAVLAGAGFAAGSAAIQKAKKTTALATCVAIESAVNNFYTEYGTMPKDNLSADTPLDTKTNLDLLTVLLGTETGTSPLNTRSVKFLSVREGKANKNGLMYTSSGTTVTGLYDPWGGSYKVMLDGDYDEKITVKPVGGTSQTLNGRRVAAWSDGADGITGAGKSTDDVTTWK
ncbi:MAG: prepilin-type N-terminal cleavage/methylation domain-containing protein [Luteolibacter sp.]